MVTKGIVQEILTPYEIRVRIPLFDGAESSKYSVKNSQLNSATICCPANMSNNVSVGDIVFIAFEDSDASKPVIIGQLFKQSITNTKLNLDINSLTTNSITHLYEQTWIGDIKPSEIKCLKGVTIPLQTQIDNILDEIEQLKNKVDNNV